jgi:hypothetical protein
MQGPADILLSSQGLRRAFAKAGSYTMRFGRAGRPRWPDDSGELLPFLQHSMFTCSASFTPVTHKPYSLALPPCPNLASAFVSRFSPRSRFSAGFIYRAQLSAVPKPPGFFAFTLIGSCRVQLIILS